MLKCLACGTEYLVRPCPKCFPASNKEPSKPGEWLQSGEWSKVAALLMIKSGREEVLITLADLKALEGSRKRTIFVQEESKCLRVRLITETEAARLVKNNATPKEGTSKNGNA